MSELIIGMAGRARHGKDTVAQVLVNEYGFLRVGFADALREMALLLNPILFPGGFVTYQEFLDEYGYEMAKETPEFRDYLKDLGEAVRNILGPDAWVRALRQRMDLLRDGGVDRFVITDVRYENEVRAVRLWGGAIVKVDRPGFDNGVDPTHPSEAYVPLIVPDYRLRNAGTIEDLQVMVRDFMAPVMS